MVLNAICIQKSREGNLMLKLVDIVKDYPMKDQEPVHALKGLSVNFRRNEFVSILGPSGCGKTTLLNIIGGLDRYTSGDLIIEGRSTKGYKDGDWDTYRNHSIGFVFQTYNLIPHQSVIKNVELALTIGGVSKEERKERALKALEKVGLAGLEKKKPNQLSGGQMQRVAIARALINEPEILLADEPTGALDSETSVQVMDLLKEVAKDCLVIMVTHNPDLANAYSSRIINMKDGVLLKDSNPYSDEEEASEQRKVQVEPVEKVNKGNKKNSSMSFLTATGLSMSNLFSKLKRTILIAIAGSIGIIGVSSVLAVSNGVHNYIDNMQNDMISQYPITVAESSIDYASLMSGLSGDDQRKIVEFSLDYEIGLDSLINYLMDKYKDFTSVKTNDINDDLIEYIENMPESYVSSINKNYGLDMTNNIFTNYQRDKDEPEQMISLNGLTQMYISELRTVEGFSEYAVFVDLFTDFVHEIPGEKDYILEQYDILAGKYPESANDIILVVDENQTLTDLVYAQMGFFNETEFINIARKAMEEHEENPDQSKIDSYTYPTSYTFDQILGKTLKYYPHDSIWNYQTITKKMIVFSFPYESDTVTLKLYHNPATDDLEGTLIYQDYNLNINFLRKEGSVKDEENPSYGEWTGNILNAMEINFGVTATNIVMHTEDYGDFPLPYTIEEENTTGYMYNAVEQNTWTNGEEMKISGILKKKAGVNFGCLDRGVYHTREFTKKMIRDSKESRIVSGEHSIEKYIGSSYENEKAYEAYVTYKYTSYSHGDGDKAIKNVDGIANALNTDFSSSLGSMLSIRGTSNLDLDKAYLRSLSGLASKEAYTIGNYSVYKFEELPKSIDIYPKDFKLKKSVVKYLKEWNEEKDITLPVSDKVLKAEDRQELNYTDTVEIIVNVINTLINVITIALVAFTSLALVVSCFMIAVITYISTMERLKEIGVIRSLGGRKKDVSRLFVAETLIIGLASGIIGIGVTYLLSVILNLVLDSLALGVTNIANLPFLWALIMIGLSIALNVISGLIPSMKASHQDPVAALRSE